MHAQLHHHLIQYPKVFITFGSGHQYQKHTQAYKMVLRCDDPLLVLSRSTQVLRQ